MPYTNQQSIFPASINVFVKQVLKIPHRGISCSKSGELERDSAALPALVDPCSLLGFLWSQYLI